MRIGEAAERLGVTPRTIKYYEELGLLAPERSGTYRELSDDDIERVERIRNMQSLGLSLAAIREFLKYRRQVDESGNRRLRLSDLEAVARSLEAELAEVRARIARARAELEQGEKIAVELQTDLAKITARLNERRGEVVRG